MTAPLVTHPQCGTAWDLRGFVALPLAAGGSVQWVDGAPFALLRLCPHCGGTTFGVVLADLPADVAARLLAADRKRAAEAKLRGFREGFELHDAVRVALTGRPPYAPAASRIGGGWKSYGARGARRSG